MSRFWEEHKKWHIKNNNSYDTARDYHEALRKHFKDWQPPKQLVVVPKFVAEFIEEAKADFKLFGAFNEISEGTFGDDLRVWVFGKNNQDKFANAWANGYTVEKEKLYELVFFLEDDDKYLLMKNGETTFHDFESQNEGYFKQEFTEYEIKAIDERLMVFAVEVDEVTE